MLARAECRNGRSQRQRVRAPLQAESTENTSPNLGCAPAFWHASRDRRIAAYAHRRQTLFSLALKGVAAMPTVLQVTRRESEIFGEIGANGLDELLNLLAESEARLA